MRAVQKDLLDTEEAQGLLDKMVAAGYRSPVQRLDEFFKPSPQPSPENRERE